MTEAEAVLIISEVLRVEQSTVVPDESICAVVDLVVSDAVSSLKRPGFAREALMMAIREGIAKTSKYARGTGDKLVAQRFGVCTARCRQVRMNVLRILRHPSRSRMLWTFVPGRPNRSLSIAGVIVKPSEAAPVAPAAIERVTAWEAALLKEFRLLGERDRLQTLILLEGFRKLNDDGRAQLFARMELISRNAF